MPQQPLGRRVHHARDISPEHGGVGPRTLSSLLFANLTTVAGFGPLLLSGVPVLQAMGATVAPGALLALLFSAMLSPAARHTAAS